jgi:hypothetical protein
MNHRQFTHHPVFDKQVELHWWTCGDKVIGYHRDSNPGSFNPPKYWYWLSWSIHYQKFKAFSPPFCCSISYSPPEPAWLS